MGQQHTAAHHPDGADPTGARLVRPSSSDGRAMMTIRAPTSAAALAEVQRRLGEDAIVLETKTVQDEQTGQRMVEVSVTADGLDTSPARVPSFAGGQPAAPSRAQAVAQPELQATHAAAAAPAHTATPTDRMSQMMASLLHEVRALRSDVRDQRRAAQRTRDEINAFGEQLRQIEGVVSGLSNEHALIRERALPSEWIPGYRRLIAAQIDATIAEEIIEAIVEDDTVRPNDPQALEGTLTEVIARRIRTQSLFQSATHPAAVAIVGPAGSGKTSLVGKLAAHAVLRAQPRVGIVVCEDAVSSDNLIKVAGALDIQHVVAKRDDGALAGAVRDLCRSVDTVLIDTPSFSVARDDDNQRTWRELSAISNVEIVATFDATMREIDMNRAARTMAGLGFHRLAFTRYEETLRLGGILNLVESTGRPIAALSVGPRIPDDLVWPDPHSMANRMIRPPRAGAHFSASGSTRKGQR